MAHKIDSLNLLDVPCLEERRGRLLLGAELCLREVELIRLRLGGLRRPAPAHGGVGAVPRRCSRAVCRSKIRKWEGLSRRPEFGFNFGFSGRGKSCQAISCAREGTASLGAPVIRQGVRQGTG